MNTSNSEGIRPIRNQPEMSLGARGQHEGKSPEEVTYDTLLERNGTELIYYPSGTR